MKLKEVMTKEVETIRPDANLQETAKLMKERDIGSLPVLDGDRLVGMITDRDLVIRSISENRDNRTAKVKDVMSTPIVYCFEDQDAEEVARIMEVKKLRRVVVLNKDKRMVGIVSLDNLSENQALAGEVLANLTHSIHTKAA
jgi:CBS domain-containing protein